MSRWSNGEYRSPHGGDNVFGWSSPNLWDSRPMKSPFPPRNSAIYDWRSGDDENPPPGGSKVPRKPKTPVGSGGMALSAPTESNPWVGVSKTKTGVR